MSGSREQTVFTREMRFLRPWISWALVWLMLSVTITLEYLRLNEPRHLFEICGFLSLFWMQFGFAGLFHTLRKERGRRVIPFLLIAPLPRLSLVCVTRVLGG